MITSNKTINKSSNTLKYLQLAEFINKRIEEEQLLIGDKLPSVNELMNLLRMSKATVLKGLSHLSEKGIVEAVYRKGYYVRKKTQYKPYRVCLILDKMNLLRDSIYHSFFEKLKGIAEVDIFFHHHNIKVLKI